VRQIGIRPALSFRAPGASLIDLTAARIRRPAVGSFPSRRTIKCTTFSPPSPGKSNRPVAPAHNGWVFCVATTSVQHTDISLGQLVLRLCFHENDSHRRSQRPHLHAQSFASATCPLIVGARALTHPGGAWFVGVFSAVAARPGRRLRRRQGGGGGPEPAVGLLQRACLQLGGGAPPPAPPPPPPPRRTAGQLSAD
jgi:hypothetical protein